MKKKLNRELETFYKNQEIHHSLRNHKGKASSASEWRREDTVDAWRHKRMYSFVDPLVSASPHSKWLTVGDGRYGKEAHYLQKSGVSAIATDIADSLLRKAKRAGFINAYKKENAENLSLKDESFDFVLCKESYHHFPRPMMALYEMLRVAKQAVILIEPNDVRKRGFSWSRLWSVEKIGDQVNRFEESGNYVYSLTRREIEKAALGIGLPTVAFAGIDDHYIKGIENESLKDNTPSYRKIKLILWILDIAHKLGIRDRSLLVSVIFKKKPGKKLVKSLKNAGFEIHDLPRNPYLK